MNKNVIQYRIATWQDTWGQRKWGFTIGKYIRVTFKRSQRQGWQWLGFVKTEHDNRRFDSRAEALACAKKAKAGLWT